MLAQASARERELAIRSALGAARGRLVRQYLTEAFLLSLAGGRPRSAGGILELTWFRWRSRRKTFPASRASPSTFRCWRSRFCFLPRSRSGWVRSPPYARLRADVREGLGEGGRAQAGSQGSQRIGRVIVAAQIAITLVLVVGAGLLGRSLMKVLEVDPGFRVDKIVTMDVSLPWDGWTISKAKAGEAVFYPNLIDRLKQIPGVASGWRNQRAADGRRSSRRDVHADDAG